jgi:hypothetical protein
MLIEYKVRNNFPFRIKFKLEIEFELKILEAELFFNLIQIYWGSKLVWKNLVNSQKFLFTLIFPEYEFRLAWLHDKI